MKCVTPMFRYYERGNHKKGYVVSREAAYQELKYDDSKGINLYRDIKNYNQMNPYHGMELIPCQHCWACYLNKSAEWATRIMCEVKKYEHNYFVTLTYDDEHLPIAEKLYQLKKINIPGKEPEYEMREYENDGTWEGTLQPHDHDKFINSLRKHFERKGHKGIKYYMAGEYGERKKRPHMHYILMNLPLDEKQFYDFDIDENYKAHWKSKELEKIWPNGIIDIAEVEWSCAAYVARYCTKKIFKSINDDEYYKIGKLPEFTRMSTKDGGIGREYYEKHKHEIYKNDEMIGRTVKGNISRYKPPKSWDKLFKEEFPKEWEKIKASRMKASERAEKLLGELTDRTDLELQELRTRKVLEKHNMLPRIADF